MSKIGGKKRWIVAYSRCNGCVHSLEVEIDWDRITQPALEQMYEKVYEKEDDYVEIINTILIEDV